jgi:MFS family permease
VAEEHSLSIRPRRTVRNVIAHRYFADLSRNTFLLALARLFADTSTEMLYPVLPIFLTQTLKASGSVVGLVEGVAGATQNVVQGFSGSLSDKLQRRKPIASAPISYPAGFLSDRLGRRNILVLSFAIFLATYLGFALARNIPLVALLFVCYGLYQGIFRSVGKALASDYVPEPLRASGVGWYNTIAGLCGLVVSLVAEWL